MLPEQNVHVAPSEAMSPQALAQIIIEAEAVARFDSNLRKLVKTIFPKTYRKKVIKLAYYFATNAVDWKSFQNLVRLVHDTKSNSVSESN